MHFLRRSQAFTLIELLVVIAIIGILAILVVVNLEDAQTKARNSKAQSDISAMGNSIEIYKSDNSNQTIRALSDNGDTLTGSSITGYLTELFDGSNPFYTARVSSTPGSAYTYTYKTLTPDGIQNTGDPSIPIAPGTSCDADHHCQLSGSATGYLLQTTLIQTAPLANGTVGAYVSNGAGGTIPIGDTDIAGAVEPGQNLVFISGSPTPTPTPAHTPTPTPIPTSRPTATPVPPAPTPTPSPNLSLYQMTNSPLMAQYWYTGSHLSLVGSIGANSQINNDYDNNTNYDPTNQSRVYCSIEEQRAAADGVEAAVHSLASSNPPHSATTLNGYITSAEQVIDWGLRQQGTDYGQPGGFPCNAPGINVSNNASNAFHSTSFFVEGTARSMLEMQQAPVTNNLTTSDKAAYTSYITGAIPNTRPYPPTSTPIANSTSRIRQLYNAALWEISLDTCGKGTAPNYVCGTGDGTSELVNGNKNFHRRWLLAAGFAETAKVIQNLGYGTAQGYDVQALYAEASKYAQQAITINNTINPGTNAGFFPEGGPGGYGYDLSYNMVGMYFGTIYASTMQSSDTPSYSTVTSSLTRGLNWGASKFATQAQNNVMIPNEAASPACSTMISHNFQPGEATDLRGTTQNAQSGANAPFTPYQGNTRVYYCTGEVGPAGAGKSMDYRASFQAFTWAGALMNNTSFTNLAGLVGNFAQGDGDL